MTPLGQKIRELSAKRAVALAKLVEPARAAANAMKDAGMNRSADPLLEALFEHDAIVSEMRELFESDRERVITELFGPPPQP